MKTNFIRQIVIAFAIIALVYPSVFAQNSNLTVDYVNNPPLVEGKIAYGYLSEIHKSQITNVTSPHNFYAEVGVGLGNILRVCDLYSVWGYTKDTRWQWAMRFRIHLGL